MKILMIDDEADIRRIGELSLRGVGKHDVTLAASGPDGIEAAARIRPDLILLDVMMPGMDGPTALARLRAMPETSPVPVIFLTAKVQKMEVENLVSLGALGVIAKPFDPMSLPKQVARLLATARGADA